MENRFFKWRRSNIGMFHFGFSYVGFIYLLMLFIPNIIWTKHKPVNYEEYSQKESKVLQIIEKTDENS